MPNQQVRRPVADARSDRVKGDGAEAGDAQQLLATYGQRLYGFFLRATGSHHDAEDLLGELMLRVIRSRDSYDERGKVESWLFRIAANLLRDRIRRKRSSPPGVSLEAETPAGLSVGEALSDDSPMPDEAMLTADVSVRVQKALARLDESSRQMVLLRHFAEMSFKEIAEIFSCPIGTVLAKVHRALKSLREILEDEHELE
jgi:RNA polymerase sigma-70 factor, ECF subfamily